MGKMGRMGFSQEETLQSCKVLIIGILIYCWAVEMSRFGRLLLLS